MLEPDRARRLIAGKPWHHDFEVVPGVRTGGSYDPTTLWGELELPADLTGLRLADVGASNGFFSFEARKRGAQVEAFDFRHKDNSGFGLLQHLNGMTDIAHHHVNVLDLAAAQHGRFDIVLALGLLYHVADPYRALANCAALSRRRLLVESYCIDDAGAPDSGATMRFIPDPIRFPEAGHVNNDRSNFWGPSSACLCRMIEDVGFAVRRMRVTAAPGARVFLDAERVVPSAAGTRLGMAYGTLTAVPAKADRDDPAAWTIF